MTTTTAASLEEKALPGATDHDHGHVTFALFAPNKQTVHLIGDFNNWNPQADPMHDRGAGFWVAQKHLDNGEHRYQFVVDGRTVICDPYAQSVEHDDKLDAPPRAVIQAGREQYPWEHDGWVRPAFRDLIIYETHIGDFSPEGNLRGMISRLDYLRDLGVNCIELMPVYETAPHDYWGYEPRFYLALRRSFGAWRDMCELVDQAHARGMAVLLDLVLAHTGMEHPFNQLYPYDQSPWYGQGLGEPNQFGLPMLDFTKQATNSFVRDVQSYWLRVFHVDGFRYDYLAGIGQGDGEKGLPYLINIARSIRPDAYLAGEYIPENPDAVNDSQLSGIWHTRCRLALTTLLTGKNAEPYKAADFDQTIRFIDPTVEQYRDGSFMINYLECHDDPRGMDLFRQAGDSDDIARRKTALAMTTLMTMPGEPMFYHGQEMGESSQKRMEPNPIHWDLLDTQGGRGLMSHLQALCRLRKERASLRGGIFSFLYVWPNKRCVAFFRQHGEVDCVATLLNFSNDAHELEIPVPTGGKWKEFFSNEVLDIQENIKTRIEPLAAKIFLQGPT